MHRVTDLIVASAVLVILSPLLALVALLIRMTMGSPVIYKTLRLGIGARPFRMYKFRTMSNDVDRSGNLLAPAERVTRLGSVLRATSFDEIPELWNVLRGQMSIIGPRPLHARYADRYTETQMRRHDVLPGLTGYAQVNGRNLLSWEERFELDVWYVDNRTLAVDMSILAKTVVQMFTGRGVRTADNEIMPEFLGNDEPDSPDSDFRDKAS